MSATGIGKSWMVKKTKKASRGTKNAAADLQIISANNPPAHQPTISLPAVEPSHQASQPTTLPQLSQITASRLGLEILNHNVPDKDQTSTLMPAPISKHTSAKAGGNEIATQNLNQKQDWLRPDTPRSEAEEDRLLTTQTRLLKRRFDEMRGFTEEEGPRSARKERVAGEHKPLFSVEEALTMGRAGSAKAYLKEQLEYNLLERERMLRLLGEME